MEIRRLGPDDAAPMRALNQLFARAFDEAEKYALAPPDETYLRRQLARPDLFVLAAWREGRLAGGLVAHELPKLEQARCEVYLYDLAVAEEARRQGVATALIRELQRLAAQAGAWVVFVQADYGDDPAIALYTKLGQREEVLHFDLPLP